MNRRYIAHNFEQQQYPRQRSPPGYSPFFDWSSWNVPDAFIAATSMIQQSFNMSAPHSDVPADERIHPEDTSTGQQNLKNTSQCHSSHDGDVVIVQPSFDDATERKNSPLKDSPQDLSERQSRSPDSDEKEGASEMRSSPTKDVPPRQGQHTRDLSAHFFDATTLGDEKDPTMNKDAGDVAGRKHRRIFSGDLSNPMVAHRRLDSLGTSSSVRRNGPASLVHPDTQNHHRVDSAGLDILSAAADATQEELAMAAGANSRTKNHASAWSQSSDSAPSRSDSQAEPRPSIGQVSTGSFEQPPTYPPQPPDPGVAQPGSMQPPSAHSRRTSSLSNFPPIVPYGAVPPHGQPYHPQPPSAVHMQHYPVYPPPYYGGPPPPGYYPAHGGHHRHHSSFGAPPSHLPPAVGAPPGSYPPGAAHQEYGGASKSDWEERHRRSLSTQGSQTFVTAIAVGSGNKTMHASVNSKNAATNTEAEKASHHRKMSSFGSIGSFLGGSLFPENDKPGHHRKTSSTMSFLLDTGLEATDDVFLRNLQASNAGAMGAMDYRSPTPPGVMANAAGNPPSAVSFAPSTSGGRPSAGLAMSSSQRGESSTKLAAGGTSKRVRRKCTIEGCENRVVQGGLCITHGARRKICKHPGCNKNVKKAGLCSTHGPARKRCEHEGCSKVAVQGGRCISHGAKKKLCSVEKCSKQAILGGMCKKHHDQLAGPSSEQSALGPSASWAAKPSGAVHKPTHTRGLSIFQEMSADTVSTLLNDDGATPPAATSDPRFQT